MKADRVRTKVYATGAMHKFALTLAAIALAVTACSKPASKAPSAVAAGAQAPSSTPGAALRLPTTVQPVSYRIDITPDAQKLTFAGSETIQIQVNQETPTITLNALELGISRATLDGKAAAKITMDADRQTATFDFGQAVAPGSHALAIDYTGKIDDFSSGLFHLDYNTAAGPRRMLVTQFENADARRLAPMWDDPAVKATFQMSLVGPADQMAVSNMPAQQVQTLAGGLQRTTFQPSPKMSSYLVFLGLGDFERINRNVDGVDVGVIVRRGETVKAAFALDEASAILRYYDDYFGIHYPLPKLDLVAAPGSGGFGAMENWGAIMYFERDLLIDPAYSTQQDRQDVSVTIAHEMAHQWFGDLVTMQWWNDLWLNESFAEWMEGKAVDHLHPEWRVLLSESAGRESAMKLDSASATHPIVRPVETTQQMNEIGDAITYDKGMAVLRMLEAYVGPDAWRRGVQAYLNAHAYGNATHDDLWRAIEAAAGKPMTGMAEDFTEQDGVPLIGVQVMASQKGSGVLLTEERFAADAGSKAPRHWRTPVAAKPLKGAEVQTVVHGGPLVTSLTSPDPGPLIVNPGQVGYYRTWYTKPAFDPLAQKFGRLDAFDQQNMLQDAWALAQAGYAPPSNLMELLSRLPTDAYPLVWANAADMISEIYYLHAPKDRPAFAAYGRRILDPVLARIGWTARPGEPAAAAVARENLILALGDLGDQGVVTLASLKFQEFLSAPRSLPADIRRPVLYVIGEQGGGPAFDALQRLALASTDPLEQRQYLTAMARAEDPALAQRALDFALSPQVQHSAGMTMIRTVAARRPDLAWRFAMAHKSEIDARSDAGEKLFFIPELLNSAADAALADQLHAFADKAYQPGGRESADKTEARVRQRADVRTNQLPKLDAWLKGRSSAG